MDVGGDSHSESNVLLSSEDTDESMSDLNDLAPVCDRAVHLKVKLVPAHCDVGMPQTPMLAEPLVTINAWTTSVWGCLMCCRESLTCPFQKLEVGSS